MICHLSDKWFLWISGLRPELLAQRRTVSFRSTEVIFFLSENNILVCQSAVFAMHPRQRVRYRLHLAVHHSPACTAVPRTNAYRRNSPSSQWEAVVEVSLSPWGIVAPCSPRQGQQGTVSRSGYAVLAPSCSPLRPTGDCTRNAVYAIVKLRERTKLSSHCS